MIKVTVKNDFARVNRVLNKIPQQMQFAAYDKALPAAGKVVQERASELAPRSANNPKGGAEKWSAKTRADWSSIPLADLIITKLSKNRSKADPFIMVGPKFNEGNKANFVAPMVESHKEQVNWGERVGNKSKNNDFLKRAADETIPAQLRAFLRALIPDVRRRLKTLKG